MDPYLVFIFCAPAILIFIMHKFTLYNFFIVFFQLQFSNNFFIGLLCLF